MRKYPLVFCICLLLPTLSQRLYPETAHTPDPSTDPYLTGILATVIPGGGHFLLGDPAAGTLVLSLTIPLALPYYLTTEDYPEKALKMNAFYSARNLYFFSVYDAFQKALDARGREESVVDIPRYSLPELLAAPFDRRTYTFSHSLSKLYFYGMIGGPAAVTLARVIYFGVHPDLTPSRLLLSVPLMLFQTLLIGIGEETFTRGFLYPLYSRLTGSALFGNLLQSIHFGLLHTDLGSRLGLTAVPFGTGLALRYTSTIDWAREYRAASSPSDGTETPDIEYFAQTAIMGAFLGLIASEERDGLLKAVTIHVLYNTALILGDLISTGSTGRFYLEYGLSY